MTISAADFQRMVYSAHLLTQLNEKPELDASLRVLLEMHRRNPNASPAVLAGVSREAVARYRTNAPSYIRASGARDEALAAYLDAWRQVPARTGFIPANLPLLNQFMLQPSDYATASAAELIHSGNRRLLSSEGETQKRQAMLDACVDRASGNGGFAVALDSLLVPETFVSCGDTPANIIGNTNSPLHGNPTFTTLLALSTASGNGGLTVSSNQLMNLFDTETATFWSVINTNLALQREINQSQPDLLAYLANQPAIDANAQRIAAVQQGQSRRIACSTAAVLVQSKLMEAKDPLIKLPGQLAVCADSINKIAEGVSKFFGEDVTSLGKIAGTANILSGGLQLFNMFFGGESAEDAMAREIGNVKTLIGDLNVNMNYRFDRVDQSLVQIFDTLNDQFGQVTNYFDAQGRQIARLNGSVEDVRQHLVDVQTDIHRLERHVLSYVNELYARGLNQDFNTYLGYESTYPSDPMTAGEYNGTDADFFTHARNNSTDGLSSPYSDRVYTPAGLYSELTESGNGVTNRLDQNLSYIKSYLTNVLGQSTGGPLPMANPRAWFVGTYAYLQLAVENPLFFRQVNVSNRLDLITARGREITNFLGSLTFTGPNINWSLRNALENSYVRELTNLTSQVRPIEQQFAVQHGFAMDLWRQWAADAPPSMTVTSTKITATPAMVLQPIPRKATRIAAGGSHNLALKDDGTIVAWGNNTDSESTIPSSLTNALAIGAGLSHSLAVRPNHSVVAWGLNSHGQTNVPGGATNIIAVSAGHLHSLALRSNGTVVAWGAGINNTGSFPQFGQAIVPLSATNITAIAGGGYHSLALRADGTLLAWGLNNEGQLNIPANATNIIAIAAGHGHNLALKSNGTLIAWGNNNFNDMPAGITNIPSGATNIVAIAAAGWHCVALRSDGKVLAWGVNDDWQCMIPPGLSGVQSLSAGISHSVALKTDGTVVVWGNNSHRECLVPPSLTRQGAIATGVWHFLGLRPDGTTSDYGFTADYGNRHPPEEATDIVAIAAGEGHSLALRADGMVVGWGMGWFDFPVDLTNAIAIAAGYSHNVALRNDGTVACWGNNGYGQINVPAGLANVVAIAAGKTHNLALRKNGTVVAWGDNRYGQTNVPAGLSNVVMLAAGGTHNLALKSDGTIMGWGTNDFGQISIPASATNIVAIAAGNGHSLALRADGRIVGWGYNNDGRLNIPASLTNVVAIAAADDTLVLQADGVVTGLGDDFAGHSPIPENESSVTAIVGSSRHSLALRANGTVFAWGRNSAATMVPPGLSNIVAIAAGNSHSLALRRDRVVLAWGDGYNGNTNIPPNATNVVAIAAGLNHSLALRADGRVVAWGSDYYGQATIPSGLSNVVMVAAGLGHSLALRADGTVVAWGGSDGGSTPPANVTNVVAIAAGGLHNIALRADGSVVCWGYNNHGQTDVPANATNVVAIAAGYAHCLALRADGSLVGWGNGFHGQTTIPSGATNVVAIACGGDYDGNDYSLFLSATSTAASAGGGTTFVVRPQIPNQVGNLFQQANALVLTNLDFNLRETGVKLSGTKALVTAVLELGLPYTLERDDVLHGFLYGTERLMDLDASRSFLQSENAKLAATPGVAPQSFTEVAVLRYLRFSDRLQTRLNDLQASGQPEIPRLVSHTLRLCNVLRDSWASVPPSALEISRQTNTLNLVLYGEPYAHHALQYSENLGASAWSTITSTSLHNEERFTVPVSSNPQRFFRVVTRSPSE